MLKNPARLAALALLIATAVLAQTNTTPITPSIKGLHLGETLAEFTQAKLTGPAVSNCHQGTYDEKQKALLAYTPSAPVFSHGRLVSTNEPPPAPSLEEISAQVDCEEYTKVENTHAGVFTCTKDDTYFCTSIRDTAVNFEDDKIVSIYTSTDADFADVQADAVSKFGRPTDSGVNKLENGYGATFQARWAAWKTTDYVVQVQEKVSNTGSEVHVLWQTAASYAAEHQHATGTLD
jgi:hypothetical protein